MNKFKKCIFILVAFFCFMGSVEAAKNPYPKYEESPFGGKIINCTWYAWQQAKDNAGVELPLWTYVQTWYSKAKKAGYSVGKEPKPNSIMVWDYGEGFGGHVAYVTSVNGTTVTYNEGGSPMTADGINTDSMTLDMMDSFLVGFIYLDNVPVKPTTTKKVTTSKKITTKKTTTTTEVIKSSNNYLSELTITGIEINFQKEVLDYTFDVANDVENIKIDAKGEDSKAIISGVGEFALTVGENNFTIKVTAEDSTIKEYHVSINRQQEIKKENSIPTQKKSKLSKKMTIIISAISTLLIITLIGILLFLLNKKK